MDIVKENIEKLENVINNKFEEKIDNAKENIENSNEEVIDKSLKTDILLSDCEQLPENNKEMNEELDKTILIRKKEKNDVSEKINIIFKNIFPFRGVKN